MSNSNYSKKIVCLANSRKNSGRCVAGKIVDGDEKGSWIRPVGTSASAEIIDNDRRYQNSAFAEVGDIILIPMERHSAHEYQTENHLIDAKFFWTKAGQLDWGQLEEFLDNVQGPLWVNNSSSYNGRNDRVDVCNAAAAVQSFGNSLCLIKVSDLKIIVRVEGAEFDNPKRHVRGEFSYDGHQYRMMITDPIVEAEFLSKNDAEYNEGSAILCISLGNSYNGHAYKLIATVIRN